MILGMVQTPYDYNFVGRIVSTRKGNEVAFFLECESNTNSVITQPELDYFVQFKELFEWDTGPLEYSPIVNESECEDLYNDIRITSVSMNWNKVIQSDLIEKGHDAHFDPICGICNDRINEQVCEVESSSNVERDRYISGRLTYEPVNMYAHKNCLSYFMASVLEGIERYGNSTEALASMI